MSELFDALNLPAASNHHRRGASNHVRYSSITSDNRNQVHRAHNYRRVESDNRIQPLSAGWDSRLRLGPELDGSELRVIGRHLHLRYNKWYTQVGDFNVISPQPLFIRVEEWNHLCCSAERLACEMISSKLGMLDEPIVLALAGVPKALRDVLRRNRRNGARCMRFDFRPTSSGWQVAEVNSDVPGGWKTSRW